MTLNISNGSAKRRRRPVWYDVMLYLICCVLSSMRFDKSVEAVRSWVHVSHLTVTQWPHPESTTPPWKHSQRRGKKQNTLRQRVLAEYQSLVVAAVFRISSFLLSCFLLWHKFRLIWFDDPVYENGTKMCVSWGRAKSVMAYKVKSPAINCKDSSSS